MTSPTTATTIWDTQVVPPPTLLPQHQALLDASGIDAATVSARGIGPSSTSAS